MMDTMKYLQKESARNMCYTDKDFFSLEIMKQL
jgi:hypothetical protein